MQTDEVFAPVFFDPRPLTNLVLIDELESLSPVLDMQACSAAFTISTCQYVLCTCLYVFDVLLRRGYAAKATESQLCLFTFCSAERFTSLTSTTVADYGFNARCHANKSSDSNTPFSHHDVGLLTNQASLARFDPCIVCMLAYKIADCWPIK